jgi:hypothetical protein
MDLTLICPGFGYLRGTTSSGRWGIQKGRISPSVHRDCSLVSSHDFEGEYREMSASRHRESVRRPLYRQKTRLQQSREPTNFSEFCEITGGAVLVGLVAAAVIFLFFAF